MFQQVPTIVVTQLLQTLTEHGLPMLLVTQTFLLRILIILLRLQTLMNSRIDESFGQEQMV